MLRSQALHPPEDLLSRDPFARFDFVKSSLDFRKFPLLVALFYLCLI